jgi:magnesium transporter
VIRGIGLYTPTDVTPLGDAGSWEEPGDTQPEALLRDLRARSGSGAADFVWVGMFEPTKDELDMVTRVFEISPLQIEDAANPDQRPKFEIGATGHGLAVVKVLDYLESSSDVLTGQIAVFVGPDFALTIRYGQTADVRDIRERLEQDPALRAQGPVSVLYAVLDKVVDGYLTVTSELTVDVEAMETEIFAQNPSVRSTNSIYRLKRENVEIRRAVQPLMGWAHEAVAEQLDWVPTALRPYFRDIGDHLLRSLDATESMDSLLLAMLMASTSLQDLQQNRDMRKISAWVAIAAVPTAIAAIYGMNFDDMPELHWSFGYPAVLIVMGTSCALLYRAFRKSGWL